MVDIANDLTQSGINYRICILENGSGDDLSGVETEYRDDSNVSFVFSPANLGFSRGHNLLAKQATGRTILVMNPDIRITQPRTVARLLDRMDEATDIKAVGPALLTPAGVIQSWDHGDFTWWSKSGFVWREHNQPTDVAWISGAMLLTDKKMFDDLCGFDPDFFLYGEDNDFGMRVRQTGGRLVYDPTVEVMHYGSVTGVKYMYGKAAMDLFLRKHHPGVTGLILRAYNHINYTKLLRRDISRNLGIDSSKS